MNHLVATYGYLAVFVVVTLEAFGIPIPGEAILIAAGTYAGTKHTMSVWLIWLLAAVGVEVGATLGFIVGRTGGYKLVHRYGRYIHMREKEMKVGRYVFDRYGTLVVSLGRFVAVLRTYAGFLAGVNRMHPVRFQVANIIGGVAWTGVWSLLSFYLGKSLTSASKTADYAIGAVAVVLVVFVIWFVRSRAKQLEAAAEAAYPGPLED